MVGYVNIDILLVVFSCRHLKHHNNYTRKTRLLSAFHIVFLFSILCMTAVTQIHLLFLSHSYNTQSIIIPYHYRLNRESDLSVLAKIQTNEDGCDSSISHLLELLLIWRLKANTLEISIHTLTPYSF